MAMTLDGFAEVVRKVWLFEDSRLEAELGRRAILRDGHEAIDFDWWEPVARWRRENAERVAHFGGEEFGRPSPPVEAPWNPERLARELEWAEENLAEEEAEVRAHERDAEEIAHRVFLLKQKLGTVR